MGNFSAKGANVIYVSYGRGIFEFSCSRQWTVQMLIEAAKSEHGAADVPIHDKPQPPADWTFQNMFERLDYGFVMAFKGYDMDAYNEDESLANESVLEADCKVYLVSRERR